MNSKISSGHLSRDAVVYIRQSTLGQVHGHTESKRRQYDLAKSARKAGFANVTVIDDDRLCRSKTRGAIKDNMLRITYETSE
jgi:DNA invertase Pin-like site-specific DNA recombinase